MDSNKWIYKTDDNNRSRFVLGIEGVNPLICFGINPSTAAPGKLDNTVKSVERLAFNNGFDSWIMLNLYPQRATQPAKIHKRLQAKLHQENLYQIEKLIANYNQLNLWAAWGTLIEFRSYFFKCLSDIKEIVDSYSHNWIKSGDLTKAGHPRHPLYLKASSTFDKFEMENYFLRKK
ncbi:MAG: hypothetical protein C0599_06790 [Salinivirgaceae bacterium]|nr:MAG: hypothetical protein C0599_06790 [Salinivirgaceae bacterium]